MNEADESIKPAGSVKEQIKKFNHSSLFLAEHGGLLVIAIATVIAMCAEVVNMAGAKHVGLSDLLLLFLYVEVLSMVGAYYKNGKLSVRYPLYIGVVALARYLVLDIEHLEIMRMFAVTASILLLTLAVLVVRFGHVRYPYTDE